MMMWVVVGVNGRCDGFNPLHEGVVLMVLDGRVVRCDD